MMTMRMRMTRMRITAAWLHLACPRDCLPACLPFYLVVGRCWWML